MVGILTVTDFRDSENWKQARLIVCTILEYTESLSKRMEFRSVTKDIERLSITVLDKIAEGYERNTNQSFLSRAQQAIDELEQQLAILSHQGGIEESDSLGLKEKLDGVKKSLNEDPSTIH